MTAQMCSNFGGFRCSPPFKKGQTKNIYPGLFKSDNIFNGLI